MSNTTTTATPPRRRRFRPYLGLYLPRWTTIRGDAPELPPRTFEAGQQPRGTVTTAEAAALLGVTPGRFRALVSETGLATFAKGPHNAAVYWAKHVEKLAESRARRAAPEEVELQLAA